MKYVDRWNHLSGEEIQSQLQQPLTGERSNSMNRNLISHPSPRKQDPPKSNALVAAFDALNAAWNEAEADFAAMRVPITVSHQVSKYGLGHPDDPNGER